MKKEYVCKNCNKIFIRCSSQKNPTYCSKECWLDYVKNPNKKKRIQKYSSDYYKENKDKIREVALSYYEKYPEKLILRRKKENCRRYNITIEEYDKAILIQENKCAICKVDFDSINSKSIHIDHDHVTNIFRGILCHNCNTALGLFKDNPKLLEDGIKYIRFNSDAFKLESMK